MQRLNQESLRFKANPVEDQVEDGWQQIMKMINKYGGNINKYGRSINKYGGNINKYRGNMK